MTYMTARLLVVSWLIIWTQFSVSASINRAGLHAPTRDLDSGRLPPGLLVRPQTHQKEAESVFMVVLVTSPAHLPQRREWQRKQWRQSLELLRAVAALPEVRFVFKFCLGRQNLSHAYTSDLDAEQRRHGDLQYVNSLDYDHTPFQEIGPFQTSATTTKVLAAVKWAVQTYKFQYLLRLGDDAYFKPDVFLRQAEQGLLPQTHACICFVVPAIAYSTPAGEVKAPYPSGMGFVLTSDVATWLSTADDMLMWGAPEDGMVGLWFAGTRVQLVHHDGFRDASWRCHGEDMLVHVLRNADAWGSIDAKGNIPCGNDVRPFV